MDRLISAGAKLRGKAMKAEIRIDDHMKDISEICRRSGVKKLVLFGSALRSDFSDESDVDVAAVFERDGVKGSFDQYFRFKEDMERLLGRPVDVVCATGVRNPLFRQEIEKTGRLIYAA